MTEPNPARLSPPMLALEYGERALLFALYAWLVFRVWQTIGTHAYNTLLVVSETLVIGFVLFRRASANVTERPVDWVLAFGGTALPLLLQTAPQPLVKPVWGVAVMALGLLVHLTAKLSLRRSFGMAAANRGLKTGGVYGLIRHPMYLGYAITWIGAFLLNPLAVNAAIFVAAGAMQGWRIHAEERLLSRDEGYRDYMKKVRWRVIPGLI